MYDRIEIHNTQSCEIIEARCLCENGHSFCGVLNFREKIIEPVESPIPCDFYPTRQYNQYELWALAMSIFFEFIIENNDIYYLLFTFLSLSITYLIRSMRL